MRGGLRESESDSSDILSCTSCTHTAVQTRISQTTSRCPCVRARVSLLQRTTLVGLWWPQRAGSKPALPVSGDPHLP